VGPRDGAVLDRESAMPVLVDGVWRCSPPVAAWHLCCLHLPIAQSDEILWFARSQPTAVGSRFAMRPQSQAG